MIDLLAKLFVMFSTQPSASGCCAYKYIMVERFARKTRFEAAVTDDVAVVKLRVTHPEKTLQPSKRS